MKISSHRERSIQMSDIDQKLKYYAKKMNNCQYHEEYDLVLSDEMKKDNIVVVHGASDDIMCFGGAICDEAYGKTYFTSKGVHQVRCEDEDCPHEKALIKTLKYFIEPIFCQEGFTFKAIVNLPRYESFVVLEDDELYGTGYVFSLDSLV